MPLGVNGAEPHKKLKLGCCYVHCYRHMEELIGSITKSSMDSLVKRELITKIINSEKSELCDIVHNDYYREVNLTVDGSLVRVVFRYDSLCEIHIGSDYVHLGKNYKDEVIIVATKYNGIVTRFHHDSQIIKTIWTPTFEITRENGIQVIKIQEGSQNFGDISRLCREFNSKHITTFEGMPIAYRQLYVRFEHYCTNNPPNIADKQIQQVRHILQIF